MLKHGNRKHLHAHRQLGQVTLLNATNHIGLARFQERSSHRNWPIVLAYLESLLHRLSSRELCNKHPHYHLPMPSLNIH
jgi:hypothetical protein